MHQKAQLTTHMAANVLKQKITKRKLLFSKWRIAGSFVGTGHLWLLNVLGTYDSQCWIELILPLCFLFSISSAKHLMYPVSVLTSNFHGSHPARPFFPHLLFAL
jgi:hypothetical protein